jgi:hypothetical protein
MSWKLQLIRVVRLAACLGLVEAKVLVEFYIDLVGFVSLDSPRELSHFIWFCACVSNGDIALDRTVNEGMSLRHVLVKPNAVMYFGKMRLDSMEEQSYGWVLGYPTE